MMYLYLIISASALCVVTTSAKTCHGHNHGCSAEINTAIENVDLYFTVQFCSTILNFDCDDHILTQDEQVCGSNGVTYDNHCLFTQARCKDASHIHGNHNVKLGIRNHGPCATPTTIPDTTSLITTATALPTALPLSSTVDTSNKLLSSQKPLFTQQSTSTNQPLSSQAPLLQKSTILASLSSDSTTRLSKPTIQASTVLALLSSDSTTSFSKPTIQASTVLASLSSDSTTSLSKPTMQALTILAVLSSESTTNLPGLTMPTTMVSTVDPGHEVVLNVFCKNADSLTCTGFNIICGSDGQFYPNECDFLKANCNDPTLTKAQDFSFCSGL